MYNKLNAIATQLLDEFFYRVLHESLYGYLPSEENANAANGDLNQHQHQPVLNTATRSPADNLDADLAMALRISEQEQRQIQEQMKREQEELEEVLRLSLQEK